MKNKTILITGGAGFIGSHTADAFIKLGAKVIIVDNLSSGKKTNIPKEAVFYKISVANSKIENIFKRHKPNLVYHFAFNVNVPESVNNPLVELESIEGSLRVFEASRKHGVKRIVFASSDFIYGNTSDLPAKETQPFNAVAPYAVSKYAIENYLQYYMQQFKIDIVIFRYSTVYGPRQIKGAMTDYIIKLASGKQASFWGNGEKTRDYIYIDDVVKANVLASKISLNKFYIFNISTGKETSLNSLYSLIAKKLKKKSNPIYLSDRPGEKMRSSSDNSRFNKVTGWKPKYSLEKGIDHKIEDVLSNNFES